MMPSFAGAARDRLPLLVTPGEPAGVGSELLLKAVAAGAVGLITIDHPPRLHALAKQGGLDSIRFYETDGTPAAANSRDASLGIIPITWQETPRAGKPSPTNAQQVINAIKQGVRLAQQQKVAGVVTNPIHKATLAAGGFAYAGHTEYLAELDNDVRATDQPPAQPVMMLACQKTGLRVVPLTRHLPLAQVPRHITKPTIKHHLHIMHTALQRDFAIAKPRIAVAGLNPHAGEGGLLGTEEESIIVPTIAEAASNGLAVAGPYAADTLFTAKRRREYDAVLAMYHDQALVAIKTLAFDTAVNITLGLSFIRTSPDHGTALDQVGDFTASPTSLMAAIETARAMSCARSQTSNGK